MAFIEQPAERPLQIGRPSEDRRVLAHPGADDIVAHFRNEEQIGVQIRKVVDILGVRHDITAAVRSVDDDREIGDPAGEEDRSAGGAGAHPEQRRPVAG